MQSHSIIPEPINQPAAGETGGDSALFQLLIDSVQDYAIFALDAQGTIGTWNSGAARLKGYRAEEAIGRHFSIFYPAQDIADGKPNRELEIAKRDGVYEEEGWRVRNDGSQFWASVVIAPMWAADGSLQGFSKVTKDITGRSVVSEQLNTFFDLSLDLLLMAGFDGYFKRVNPTWERTFGFTSAELTSVPWMDFIHPDDKLATIEAANKLFDGKELVAFEHRLQCKDKSHRWIHWNAVPDLDRRVIFAVGRDITDSKAAEEALRASRDDLELRVDERTKELRESEEKFRTTFEMAAVGMVRLTLDGRRLQVNRKLCEILGYSSEELLAQRLLDNVHPDDADEELAFMEQCVAGEIETYTVEKRYIRKDQTTVWINRTVALVRDAEDIPQYFVAIVEDISARKIAQEEMRRANQSLEKSNLELQRFAYVASHDLQTPLRAIQGFVQLLQQSYGDSLDERGRDWIRRTVGATTVMHRTIHDLLAYSRVDAEGLRFEEVEMSDVLRQAKFMLQVPIDELNARITVDELPVVRGDQAQLVQLMQNLIGNALKYNSGHPVVHISAHAQGDEWVFSVRDNGIGIEAKYSDQIFEIFQRLHNQRDYPGTGIGLAICRRVVHRHQGKIWLESKPGEGSTFFFSIPARTG